jgi:hypothetical protein
MNWLTYIHSLFNICWLRVLCLLSNFPILTVYTSPPPFIIPLNIPPPLIHFYLKLLIHAQCHSFEFSPTHLMFFHRVIIWTQCKGISRHMALQPSSSHGLIPQLLLPGSPQKIKLPTTGIMRGARFNLVIIILRLKLSNIFPYILLFKLINRIMYSFIFFSLKHVIYY